MNEESQSNLKRPAEADLNPQQHKTVKTDQASDSSPSQNTLCSEQEKSLANLCADDTPKCDEDATNSDKYTPLKATFGSLPFFKASKESCSDDSAAKPSKESPGQTPKFGATSVPVFGATTVFANKPDVKKNVFADMPSNNTPALSFGCGSRFGSALQNAVKKQSFLDAAPTESSPLIQESTAKAPEQFKQVDLTPAATITTGEEDEDSVSSAQAKLFVLDLTKVADGWKERGKGLLHLNQKRSNTREARLVMRGQGLLRVVLNYRLTATTNLIKGFDASLTPGKFVRFNSLSDDKKPIQYLIKFGSENACEAMLLKITEIINELLDMDHTLKQQQEPVSCEKTKDPATSPSPLSSSSSNASPSDDSKTIE